VVRGCVASQKHKKIRSASVRLQAAARGCVASQKHKKIRSASVRLQAAARGFLTKQKCEKVLRGINRAKALFRGYCLRNSDMEFMATQAYAALEKQEKEEVERPRAEEDDDDSIDSELDAISAVSRTSTGTRIWRPPTPYGSETVVDRNSPEDYTGRWSRRLCVGFDQLDGHPRSALPRDDDCDSGRWTPRDDECDSVDLWRPPTPDGSEALYRPTTPPYPPTSPPPPGTALTAEERRSIQEFYGDWAYSSGDWVSQENSTRGLSDGFDRRSVPPRPIFLPNADRLGSVLRELHENF
jgi:hypothetical protein